MKRFTLIPLVVITLLLSSCSFSRTPTLSIDVLSVGKADCSVIIFQDYVIVIDTAEEENANEVIGFLQSKNINKIDYLIHSHFDKDHIGGTEAILQNFTVQSIIESTFPSDRKEYDDYHKIIEDKKIPLKQILEPITITLSELSIQISPPQKTNYERKEDNNASLIVSFIWKENSFLFCGDAMEERLEEFMNENRREYDLIKLPYHGNDLNNYEQFLDHVKPQNTVICCSEKYPSDESVLKLLEQKNIPTYQTKFGSVHISSNGIDTQISYH